MRVPAVVLLALLAAVSLAAQAPKITPGGDPSVRSDTLYRLAVNPAEHPSERVVLLLDDGVVRYDADGTGTKTYRQVVQILSSDAVANYAEHEFSYSPSHQRLTINWMRVVRPDGSAISKAPAQVQDADVPAALGNPVYTDTKVRRVSLSGVAPGTIVDWSYTIEERKPFLRGDWSASWSVQTGAFTRRSRYILDLPKSITPRIVERNLPFRARETIAGDRWIRTWAAQDVPRVSGEEFMADSNGVVASIEVGGTVSWEDIGRWYAGLSRDRSTAAPEVLAAVKPFFTKAQTATDTLRAVQRWVAQDIRYVSIALGLGGYQPRPPAEVVRTGYGDCKDKATLFVAVASALGYTAYPVLLNSRGTVEQAVPSISQFDHAIALVERPEGRVFVDLTADLMPYGELPSGEQGGFALVVHPDGGTDQVRLPESSPGANLYETRIVGALASDGYIDASYEERAKGARQYALRQLFVGPIDSTRRADFARSMAAKLYPDAEADSLQIFDGHDLTAEARIALRITHGLAARAAGGGRTMILSLPFPSMRGMGDAARMLDAAGPRRFPIDAARVIGPLVATNELVLALPSGWRVDLPAPVSVSGVWGRYTATYSQESDTLHVRRRLEGTRGVYPPDTYPDLVAWFRSLAADDVPYLVLTPAAAR